MPTKIYRRQVNKNPKIHGPQAQWSEKQKYEAVALYKMVGSLRAVGRSLGIPEETMRNWHQSEWWKRVEDEITTESRVKRSKRLDKLVDLASDIIEDRLANGDYVYDAKSGTLRRKPVNALTAQKVLQTAIDKQVLLEQLAKEDKKLESQEKMTDRLATIYDQMLKFAKAKDITAIAERKGGDPESTGLVNPGPEVITSYAVHDEREEGLQEGTGVGTQEGEAPGEGSFNEELSASDDDGSREGQEG